MTTRKSFLKMGLLGLGGLALPDWVQAQNPPGIVGHGSHRYRVDQQWGDLDPSRYPIKDAHEMVVDQKGRLYLLTNETRNNVLVYDRSGKLLTTWGDSFPGGHGLTLHAEGEEEFLYICDYERHEVIKTTLDGRTILTIGYPAESGKYTSKDQFKPTETAIAGNGDIYVADGYGMQWISVFDAKGRFKSCFGGPEHFQNAHGICLDTRMGKSPSLLITARDQNQLKRFSLEGDYLNAIPLDGAYINRPVIHQGHVYLSVLKAKSYPSSPSGFVVILDENNKVVSCPGGSLPGSVNGVGLHQTVRLFQHPHDVCVDVDENLYIPQWNSKGVYPIKLERI